ncbi:hypothetical protein NDA10_000557 [Ustilago hordei]|uniref:uncharacterized protein n=1 Tax=Ustilago hordei TaxID=120017 RepID=UPI001A637EB6|nr:uncharacterized protein UHO2_05420 [Ustilago hordei]KAJ1039793.1 hypothetical protein NDA10_000557 [Ustilago hordei]UTT90680.1 hypothetical protein NDA17_004583 [Ustilago hordei]SYW86796.1 uncharacterized protein UHO2_05420 [Ustilago hordei]
MVSRHTRIISLLLLLAIHAVGVVSAWGFGSSGSDYDPKVHATMRTKAEYDQLAALTGQKKIFSRGNKDLSHDSRFRDKAFEHARAHGAKLVGSDAQELYFYSIIQPDTKLGKAMHLKRKVGNHGYVSVLWEYNKNWDKPSIFAVTRVKPLDKVENPPFKWPMEPYEKILQSFPKLSDLGKDITATL